MACESKIQEIRVFLQPQRRGEWRAAVPGDLGAMVAARPFDLEFGGILLYVRNFTKHIEPAVLPPALLLHCMTNALFNRLLSKRPNPGN